MSDAKKESICFSGDTGKEEIVCTAF